MIRWNVQAALVATIVVALMSTPLAAQDRPQNTRIVPVPESAMPPAGMCRVWLREVPERQQPAPTDCATAIRTMPRDAMVLFGDLKHEARVAPDNGSVGPAPAGPRSPVRGMQNFHGSTRTAVDVRQQPARGRVADVNATVPVAASKAPETKAVIKPEKPQ